MRENTHLYHMSIVISQGKRAKSPSKVGHKLVEGIRSLTSSSMIKVVKSLVSSEVTRNKGKLGLWNLVTQDKEKIMHELYRSRVGNKYKYLDLYTLK